MHWQLLFSAVGIFTRWSINTKERLTTQARDSELILERWMRGNQWSTCSWKRDVHTKMQRHDRAPQEWQEILYQNSVQLITQKPGDQPWYFSLILHIYSIISCHLFLIQPLKWKSLSRVWPFRPHGLYTVHGILQAWTLEWVAFPFSRGFPQTRDWTQVSRIADRFFTVWASRKAP